MTLGLNGKPVVFIDMPGLAWQPSEEEDRMAPCLGHPFAQQGLHRPHAEIEDLMVFYGLPAFTKGNVDVFLVGIARIHGFIKKVGNLISVCIVASFVNYKPSCRNNSDRLEHWS